MIRSGRLRHRLTLQSKVETRNSYGEAVISWTTQKVVWGAIEPLAGSEYLAQQQLQSEVAVRIVIRYYSGVDTTWRVQSGGKTYAIESVINENERDRTLVLMCKQGVKED